MSIQLLKRIFYYTLVIGVLFSCMQSKPSANSEGMQLANDLIHETSPYLLQHAYNPVDWKAWNEQSLQLAQKQNKLIVISIGYSACHWCHVMEEESFENDSVAKLMNENFINIKVDREERPDVDQIYINAVTLMTGSAGWPLNVITLPDGRPVFGGTYFTKKQWTKILLDMSNLYQSDPEKVIAYADQLTDGIERSNLITYNKEQTEFKKSNIQSYVKKIKENLDFENGGQKGAPKFPMPVVLEFLLRYSYQFEDQSIQDYVENTLTKMANGGLYDQIGGGFSRYSVDERWHVPHFEKMLYDNAQLVSIYSKAYQLTNNELFKTIVEETLHFAERELLDPNGAFYSSLDADSENAEGELEEGVFYSWTKKELKEALKEDYELFKAYYNINDNGKWEANKYILYRTLSNDAVSKSYGISEDSLKAKLTNWKRSLVVKRSERKRPRTDDKILTSWNALMVHAYIDAYRAIENKEYLQSAEQIAQFILDNQIKPDGGLYHSHKKGKSTIEGFSEDYAHTISALIDLYQVTLNDQWLNSANRLMTYCIDHFQDTSTRMFYFNSDLDNTLITRKIEVLDNVLPSSNSILAKSLFHLNHYYYDKTYKELSKQMIKNMINDIENAPSAYTNWLSLYMNYSNPYFEIVVSGPDVFNKVNELHKTYLPNTLMAGSKEKNNLPILNNKFNEAETYIYVCVEGSCKLPVKETAFALKQLSK